MTLSIGESIKVSITAKNKWNATGVELIAGGRYDLMATGQWLDASIPAGPAGYESPNFILRWAERWRRVPEARWFALIGATAMDDSKAFLIGAEKKAYRVAEAGLLYCYANDLSFMYWNNHGEIELKVARIG